MAIKSEVGWTRRNEQRVELGLMRAQKPELSGS